MCTHAHIHINIPIHMYRKKKHSVTPVIDQIMLYLYVKMS